MIDNKYVFVMDNDESSYSDTYYGNVYLRYVTHNTVYFILF